MRDEIKQVKNALRRYTMIGKPSLRIVMKNYWLFHKIDKLHKKVLKFSKKRKQWLNRIKMAILLQKLTKKYRRKWYNRGWHRQKKMHLHR